MNTKITCATAVAACALFIGNTAYASDGTITFTGAITAATCTVKLNGGSTASGVVTLPTVSNTVLASVGAVAGATSFAINLSSCTTGKTVNTYFEAGTTVDLVTGALINAGTATNVEVQVLTAAAVPIAVGSFAQASDTGLNTTSSASGTLNYIARYYALGASTAGTVTSAVTYSITYN